MKNNKNSLQYYDRTLNFDVEKIINEKSKKSYEFIIKLLEKYPGQISLKYGASDGEKAFIQLTACLAEGIMKISTNNDNYIEPRTCYVLLDELETHLHPEWCRKIYFKISELINKIKTEYKFVIYLSTHSPYVISDFTTDHIINLEPEDEKINFETFGANIYDILSKGMFLKNPMGEFALNKIRKVHEALLYGSSRDDILKTIEMQSEEELFSFINCIGEPLIKMQIRKLFDKKFNKREITHNELMVSLGETCDVDKVKKLLTTYGIKVVD